MYILMTSARNAIDISRNEANAERNRAAYKDKGVKKAARHTPVKK